MALPSIAANGAAGPLLPNLMWVRRLQTSVRKVIVLGLVAFLLAGAMPAGAADAGDGVTIAVLDTGVDSSHPELAGRVERVSFYESPVPIPLPVPGLPDPTSARPDPDGHGTAVASVVAGATLGIAPGARILDMQVSAKYTGTAIDPSSEEAAQRAMDELLQHHGGHGAAGPRVVVLSFATDASASGAATLAAQAHDLWSAGVLVIVPAGGTSVLHASPYVLTVGDKDAQCDGGAPAVAVLKPDLSALTHGVPVAVPGTPAAPGPSGQADGTALAAAAVAGAAARMWQARSDLPVAALAAILRDTAADMAAPGPDGCTGFGALGVDAAVAAAQAWSNPITPGGAPSAATPGPIAPLVALVLLGVALRRRSA